jgi:PhoPQ-activated pathogenicity-related protein
LETQPAAYWQDGLTMWVSSRAKTNTICVYFMDSASASELLDFVRSPDPGFAWKQEGTDGRTTRLRMTTQEWQGHPWQHDLVLVDPARRIAKDTAILYITGSDPNPLDLDEAHRLADLSGLPVAHLFQIPNQPLYGFVEDDLIAETLLRCLDSGDASWPLLFPMVKSVIRAMDGLTQATKGALTKFVVTGSSKRGWTSWLVAATGDSRVIGIAPMVFDNLNFQEQLQHQVQNWNETSEMISPYTSRGLHERIQTTEGQSLAAMIDPFTYRDQITIPKVIITGTNDPYWSVDSLPLYWDALVGPKWVSTVPNGGHGLGDMSQALHAISTLARHCVGKLSIPSACWSFGADNIEVRCEAPFPDLRLWIAESETLDFRNAEWWPRMESGVGRSRTKTLTSSFHIPKCRRNQAALVEMRYRLKDLEFSVTTTTKVWPAGPQAITNA